MVVRPDKTVFYAYNSNANDISLTIHVKGTEVNLRFYCILIESYSFFVKASKYRHESMMGSMFRKANDILILTSLVYLIACIYALMTNQFEMAFICGNTWLGSSIYHYTWESMYFNFDNVFAMSLLVVYITTLWLSCGLHNDVGVIYFWIGILGSPVALFLLYYCGKQ